MIHNFLQYLTIDGKNFKVTQLGYADGIELLTKLLALAGSAFEKNEGKDSFSLVSCSTSEEACMQECGIINLKSQNMCALENENDHSDELECSIKANQSSKQQMSWKMPGQHFVKSPSHGLA